MNNPPLVSVITPAYNAARFIGETIASVQSQTFHDWEMLVADDGSRDETQAVVERIAAIDRRIILIRLQRNEGSAAARNAALSHARGRYLCFLDADDLWLPEKLDRQLGFMMKKNCAISCTGYRRMSEDGRRVGRLIAPPHTITYYILLKNTGIANLTAMIDRDKTGPFRLAETGHEDYALWLSLLRRGLVACGTPEDLARYRVVSGSLSSRPLRSSEWVWHIYRDQEGLGFLRSISCLFHYALRAALKRRSF